MSHPFDKFRNILNSIDINELCNNGRVLAEHMCLKNAFIPTLIVNYLDEHSSLHEAVIPIMSAEDKVPASVVMEAMAGVVSHLGMMPFAVTYVGLASPDGDDMSHVGVVACRCDGHFTCCMAPMSLMEDEPTLTGDFNSFPMQNPGPLMAFWMAMKNEVTGDEPSVKLVASGELGEYGSLQELKEKLKNVASTTTFERRMRPSSN